MASPSGAFSVGIAVVGAGGWGSNWIRNLAMLPGADLRWVCDHDRSALDRVCNQFPGVRGTERVGEVFDDPHVQGVVIATDPQSHFELASHALQASKDVLVEKPLTLAVETSERLCRLADGHGRLLMTGHLMLFHPAVEALRELIAQGELGEVLYVYSQRLNLGVVRRDENAWWSLAPHDLSVANYILDAQPEGVSAAGAVFLQKSPDIEDVVFATLHYPERRLAHIHVSWLDPHKTRRLTVVGSKQMAVFDDSSADKKLMLFDKGVEPPPAASYEEGVRIRTGDIRIPALRMVEPLRRQCEAFLEAIRSRGKVRSDGWSGLAVVQALEAGQRSLRTGGMRVEI